MTNHEWKSVDVGVKTKEECREFLRKYGIHRLIHSRCQKIEERKCELCKTIVAITQLDENNKVLMGTSVNSVNWNVCMI